jgi:hypothetical protein
MALTEIERRIVATIEERWMRHASIPSPREIAEAFGLPEKKASELLMGDAIIGALKSRGIPTTNANGLNPEQVTAINTVVNPMDTRSRRKKLQDLGVSAQQWAGWMKQPKFKEYYADLSRKLLEEAIPEAHMALVDNVLRGDLGSIKYLNEMTGEYRGTEQQINPAELVQKVIEVIQVHVKDPETLLAISQDLLGLASPGRVNVNTVPGEIISPAPVAPSSTILEMF